MKKLWHFLNLPKIYFSYIFRTNKCNYPPIRLWIETSSRCNLACRLCANKSIDPSLKGDMDFDLYKKIIDDVWRYVFDVNLFHRGEPLLNPRIVDMIKYANSKAIKTRIHTNGVPLNENLSREIIKAGLNLISFSFDGYSKDTYEKNRIGASFEKTLDNIITFLKLKKELRSKTPYTIIQTMEFDENLSGDDFKIQKNNFMKKFENLPLDRMVTRNPHNWGGLLELKGIGKIDKSRVKIIPCTFPWYSLTIFYNGKVYLCPQDFEGKIPTGDVSKDSIKDIFNNKTMVKVRTGFKNKTIEGVSPCNNCDRIRRQTVAGIPKEYLKVFLKDSMRKN